MPKVSVIVPVYNVEKYIGQCIDSIIAQTFTDWELILVDDCGIDNSMSVVRKYAEKDSRIKYIESNRNCGPMVAREKGCKAATGDYVTFCDGDDSFPICALELLYKTIIENNADVVVGQFAQVDEKGVASPFPVSANLKYGNDKVAFYKAVLRFEMPQGVCGKMFKREIIKKEPIVFENVTMGEDAGVLFQYINQIERAVVVNNITYNYLQHNSSSTHRTMKDSSLEGICRLMKLRENVLKGYDTLQVDFNRYIVKALIPLYAQYRKRLEVYLSKYDLIHYVSNENISQYFSFGERLRLLVQRDIYPGLYEIYRIIR